MSNIVSVSGGKDSTAMLLKMIEENIKIDRILFADTGLELPETYEFINKLSDYCKKRIGIRITKLKSNRDWDYYFYRVIQKGKYKGNIRGFPKVTFKCWWQRDCKDKLLSKRAGKYDTVFIGFAKDEEKRCKIGTNQRYPLVEWGMTEQDCMDYCKEKGMLNPLYEKYGFKRLGCWCCPKQPIRDLKIIRDYYPDLWTRLLKYEQDSPHGFKPNFKLKELSKK